MFKTSPSKKFVKDYSKLSLSIQKKFDKQVQYLVQDLRYPSVRAKKKQGETNVWEGRVDRFYRFTFNITEDTKILRAYLKSFSYMQELIFSASTWS